MKNLSEHVTYKEATKSLRAIREGIDNTPNKTQLANCTNLAAGLIEPVRGGLGNRPLHFDSFFRCYLLNKKVGGVWNSEHRAENDSAAVDIDQDGHIDCATNAEVFYEIMNYHEFNQLIWEFGDDTEPAWVHASFSTKHNKKQVLKAVKVKVKELINGELKTVLKTKYLKFK